MFLFPFGPLPQGKLLLISSNINNFVSEFNHETKLDEVKKRESVLREISENMGLTGEQMAEILDMARKNLQLGIGRHY